MQELSTVINNIIDEVPQTEINLRKRLKNALSALDKKGKAGVPIIVRYVNNALLAGTKNGTEWSSRVEEIWETYKQQRASTLAETLMQTMEKPIPVKQKRSSTKAELVSTLLKTENLLYDRISEVEKELKHDGSDSDKAIWAERLQLVKLLSAVNATVERLENSEA